MGKHLRVLVTTVDNKNEENIELVPIKSKAGYAVGYTDPEFIKELPTCNLPFIDRSRRKYRIFPVEGDSMPPLSSMVSYVTGKYIENWLSIKDGKPYIVITNKGWAFKILYNKI